MINFAEVRERAGYKISSTEKDIIVAPNAIKYEREPVQNPDPAKFFDSFNVEAATKQLRDRLDPIVRDFPHAKEDTVLSFLLDSRGAMRGWPIVAFAGVIGWLTKELDAFGIKHEILSHTTNEWKAYAERGRHRVGRVGSLLHIVWKEVDAVAADISLQMLKLGNSGVLKDNVDGEAVEWAYSRIAARPEANKLLFAVKSGGLDPISQATELYNGGDLDLLHRHLLDTVSAINSEGDVRLSAVIIEKYNASNLFSKVDISDEEVMSAFGDIQTSASHDWEEIVDTLTHAISSSLRRSLELKSSRTPSL